MTVNGVEILRSPNERVLACIGVNDIDVARLRLLIRVAASQLRAPWRIGSPERADLLLLAPGSDAADQAALHARAHGVRCVMLGGQRGDVDALPVPFQADDVAAMLNDAPERHGGALELLDSGSPEFFIQGDPATDGGVGDNQRMWQEPVDMDRLYPRDPLPGRAEVTLPPRKSRPRRSGADMRLEELAPGVPRREPAAQDNPFLEDGGPAQAPAESSRGWTLQDRARAPASPFPEPAPPRARTPSDGHLLPEYLGAGLLVGPSRLQLPGHAELILDPKHGVYHIEGDLRSAEAYVGAPLPLDAWRPVTNTRLAQVRQAMPAQPYVRLKWLHALRAAGGYLPRHLDPGGTYWLRQAFDLDGHYDAYRRIGQALLQAHPLHEVVAMLKVPMQDVFDTVAAYEAVGMVHFRPRERLR